MTALENQLTTQLAQAEGVTPEQQAQAWRTYGDLLLRADKPKQGDVETLQRCMKSLALTADDVRNDLAALAEIRQTQLTIQDEADAQAELKAVGVEQDALQKKFWQVEQDLTAAKIRGQTAARRIDEITEAKSKIRRIEGASKRIVGLLTDRPRPKFEPPKEPERPNPNLIRVGQPAM